MSKDALLSTDQRLSVKPPSQLARRWQAVDGLAERLRRHLRPLYGALDFAGIDPDNPWLAALAWAKGVFAKPQHLSQRPLAECPKSSSTTSISRHPSWRRRSRTAYWSFWLS